MEAPGISGNLARRKRALGYQTFIGGGPTCLRIELFMTLLLATEGTEREGEEGGAAPSEMRGPGIKSQGSKARARAGIRKA